MKSTEINSMIILFLSRGKHFKRCKFGVYGAGNEVERKFATPGRSIAGDPINATLEDAAVS
jgi:hypothetical protein